jgi:hypothetical protein
MEYTAEVMLSQLGYNKTELALQQAQKAIDATKEFDYFAKHIISLHDFLQHLNAYISLSNSVNKFKIKCDDHDAPEIIDEFHEAVKKWSTKYKVALEKVSSKHVYYIVGIEK